MFLREIEGFIAVVVAYCCHRYCMAIKADIMNDGCLTLELGRYGRPNLLIAAP